MCMNIVGIYQPPDCNDRANIQLGATSGIGHAGPNKRNGNFTYSNLLKRRQTIFEFLKWVGVNSFYVFDGKLEATFATHYT